MPPRSCGVRPRCAARSQPLPRRPRCPAHVPESRSNGGPPAASAPLLFHRATERVVVGRLAFDPAVRDDLLARLADGDFHCDPYRALLQAVRKLHGASRVVDKVAIADALSGREALYSDEGGVAAFLCALEGDG